MLKRGNGSALKTGAVGYVRRSTDKQEQSIEDQKKAIERYVAENGLHLVRFYIDDAISGISLKSNHLTSKTSSPVIISSDKGLAKKI